MTYKFFFDLVTKSLFITLLSLVVGFVPNAMASDVTLAAYCGSVPTAYKDAFSLNMHLAFRVLTSI